MGKRQLKTKFISSVTDAVDKFVVCEGRRSGNTARLQQMVNEDTRFDLKTSQAHRIISAKIGGVEQHLAHFRIIRSYMREVSKAYSDGRYAVYFASLPGGQFLRLFCCTSGCTRTFQNFGGLVSVDAARSKGGTQFQLFAMTTYDANRELTLLAFGVASSEDAVTWHWFLRHCLECFPSVLSCQTERKGLKASL